MTERLIDILFRKRRKMNKNNDIRAGVIGLGMIGSGIVRSLSRSGFVPGVYDLNAKVLEKVASISNSFGSPQTVAENSDVIMICVANSDQVSKVLLGPNGILKGNNHNLIVCLVSTVSISDVQEYANLCSKQNVGFIDCGVTPGNLAHTNGMVAMIGGDNETVERAIPILEAWSKKVIYCGTSGSGMATKIARNVITFGGWRIVKEAQHLLQACGVDPQKLLEVIETSDPRGITLLSKLHQNDSQGKVPVESAEKIAPLMIKDLDAALDLALQKNVSLPATKEVRSHAFNTLDLDEPKPSRDKDSLDRGKQIADKVYGKGMGTRITEQVPDNLFATHTVEHLFADIWSRSGLSIRDRRLLTIGATAASGNFPELITIQVMGALENNEFTKEELDEIVLHLSYYAGWCKGGAVAKGISDALKAKKNTDTI